MGTSAFRCQRCGACCRAPGYVVLQEGEAERIAAFLGMDVYAFTGRYARLTDSRTALSLVEREDGACVFLEPSGCRIQPVKPVQCASFPHTWWTKELLDLCPALQALHRGT